MAEQHPNYVPRKLAVIEQIQTCLQTLQAGAELDTPLFNLYGLAGLGKTFVLQQLYDMCQKEYAQCDVVWLDFDLKDVRPIDPAAVQSYPLSLERTPWQAVAAQLQVHPDLSDSFQGEIKLDNGVSQTLDQLVDILFAQAAQPGSSRPLLLLLDSLDNLLYWKWLQAQLIKPLFEQQRTLIVCTSRVKLNWQFWELRERCLHQELEPFTLEETQDFLGHHHAAPLAETVQDLTGGYPLVIGHFVGQINTLASSEAARIAMRKTIDALSPETHLIFEHVGLLRRMHVAAMQHLLVEDWRKPENHRRLHQALAEMRSSEIIHTSPDTFERFAPAARELIQQDLEPTAYLQRCNDIAQYYYKQAWKHPKHDADALIEWLYFSTDQLTGEQNGMYTEWQSQLTGLFERILQVVKAEGTVYNKVVKADETVYEEEALGSVVKSKATTPDRISVGAKIVSWLYTDGELLQKLAKLDLLAEIQDQLLKVTNATVPIRNDLRRVTSDVLQELGRRTTAAGSPGMASFEAVLRNLLPGQERELREFERAELLDLIQTTWQSLQSRPTRTVNEFIIQLTGSGMLRYDTDRRVYTFHRLIKQLLEVTPRGRFSEHTIGSVGIRVT